MVNLMGYSILNWKVTVSWTAKSRDYVTGNWMDSETMKGSLMEMLTESGMDWSWLSFRS